MKHSINNHPRYGHVQSVAMVEHTTITFAYDDNVSHGGLPSSKIDLSISCTGRQIEASFVSYAKSARMIAGIGCDVDDEFVISVLEYAQHLKAATC